MVASGFVRKIDELGRIVLPSELRKTLDIVEKDSFEIFIENGRIVLQKYEPGDMFTGEIENLVEYKGKKFSRSTIDELVRLSQL